MGLVKRAAVEQARVFPCKHLVAEVAPYRVIGLVACHSGREQQRQRQRVIHQPRTTHGTHHKQQRVPWQERHDHQARLHKDDEKQQGIHPHAIGLHKALQVAVDVQDEVDQEGNKFHALHYPCP